MIAAEHPVVPHQSESPGDGEGKPPEDPRRVFKRRFITATIIVLLIGIPAGYLLISAGQSRRSGQGKAEEASAQGLREGWPSKMQRRIFEIPIPGNGQGVQYYETNNWKASRMYAKFRTTSAGLDRFLSGMGTGRAALEPDTIDISQRDIKITGWSFGAGERWASTTHRNKKPRPTQTVTVNMTDPASPVVYVVSAATP
ncbi:MULTISPECIES: hypothetical protein [Streptomyces]|uniref:Sugar kinase n=1 Tax=Streptomyces violaceoruber TaxID=1935 RepID=A0A1V0UIN2_STRVN|nr:MULTISPECIES: hypothetical protein [Streptomyces]MYW81558.1 hypothetical protein [Streptomyces sp. SID8369]NEC42510.1 hypothetical protein [Streptomyces sp. SID8016]ARF65113.1 hypothetical protein B1H20_29665 [Streptomyces violaceoruber]KOU04956.1 hypothetical protein ADK88_20350 [Streptomyces sp. NRRL F-2295]KOU51238.1 hypothetical protein ADK56_10495 [Streptomyces sp. MMG1522]